MHPLKWLRNLWRDRRGNALIVCAATLPLVIGSAANGVDTIQVSLAKRQLQRMADSAAIAGAYAKYQNHNVTTAVNRDLTLNDDVTLSGAPLIENAPTAGAGAGNPRAVRVVLTAQRSVPFISFFTGSTMTVRTEATATSVYAGDYCMVSLEAGNVTGVTFTGNTDLDIACGVISNATGNAGIVASGSAVVRATPVASGGGLTSSSNYASGTVFMPYSPSQPDPFTSLPTPSVPADCNNGWRQNPNQSPPAVTPTASGVYCYRGMDFNGTVTLPSGTYVIDGSTNGSLSFGAQANVTCTGCTFILTSSNAVSNPASVADMTVNGGAVMNLESPNSGAYAGVLVYQDRRSATGTTTFNGNASSDLEGAFYFPRDVFNFRGTAGMRFACIQLVARRLEFSGNSGITNQCDDDGGAEAFEAVFVRLVA